MVRRKSAERTLVTDLQQQVTALVDDLRSQSDTDPALHAKLTTEHQRALTAQRIAINYTDWREDRLTQIAVAWVLGTVFVRYCEDNELIDDPWISGPDERLKDAEDRHAAHFRKHPDQNDRDWLLASFTHLADTHPAVAGLFDKAHNPLWEANPSYEAATALLNFWRTPTADGTIPYLFRGQDTRFLGDLYQHLSTHAQKTYALLQTPDFVEEFILDLTLTPALKEFGLTPEWRHTPSSWQGPRNDSGDAIGLRAIDPACGSGHFLLGLFHRILAAWEDEAPGLPRWDLIRRTLNSVHGCDKNPFAAAIARFRLLVAALAAAGETRLSSAPSFPINIAVGDSLLHGRGALGDQGDLFTAEEPFYFATEDSDEFSKTCDLLGINSYHVTVGNPPYITVKDKQESGNYRRYYSKACGGAYALSAPFAQRIFDLAIRTGGTERQAGFTGQITANSFMKREFGKKLIERFFQTIDLTHVIDTSGAYIPGHGTPTIILAGRNRIAHRTDPIRAVLGIRGEPGQPTNAADGLVWTAITAQTARANSESAWISSADISRESLDHHPWSLSGGGALNLFEFIEENSRSTLKEHADEFGFGATTKEDEAYFLGEGTLGRLGIPASYRMPFIEGLFVRDYSINSISTVALWPYNRESLNAEQGTPIPRVLWPYRTNLKNRTVFGKTQEARGLTWYEYSEFATRRFRNRFTITFAFVSTHNHFVLDRGGKVFNRSAPVIKLPKEASEDDHLGLLGLLNSSTACFWLKQVSHDKGSQSGTGGFMHDEWERFFEFTGTKLQEFPVPAIMPFELGRLLDSLAHDLEESQPSAVCSRAVPTRERLEMARRQYEATRGRMIAVQEELDWQVYGIYGLLDQVELKHVVAPDSAAVSARLGERAFEIVLARQVAAGAAETVWFARHGSEPVTDVPAGWSTDYANVVRARVELIEKRTDIALLERPDNKRRWAHQPWEEKEADALATWILDRCEQKDLWFAVRDGLSHPRTLTVGELADRFKDDSELRSVATLYAEDHLDKRDVPLAEVLDHILRDQHVPYLSTLRYKDSGLRKRAAWEQTWELQRQEDHEDRKLDIPIPPKYVTGDFRMFSYWSQRGKLDVPKERFISYLGAARHKDDPLLLGWAGWDHKDQAQALVNLVNDRQLEDGWGREQLLPVLAGLLEVMPWVRQWHGEYDAEWDGNPAEEFQAFLEEKTAEFQISERELREWRPSKEFLKGARG